jgi:XTP/dITP diphosphohydrolase
VTLVVLASRNEHKLRELRRLLPGWTIEPLARDDFPPEDATTFYENARAKALFARDVAGGWVLGEDSGLAVDALGGAPGLRSARYAGEGATDADNVARLLAELRKIPPAARGAHYVSELVCLAPDGTEYRGTGLLAGRIVDSPRGTEGFGYDPVFAPGGEEATVAELGNAWKAKNSHRARAARALVRALRAAGAEL